MYRPLALASLAVIVVGCSWAAEEAAHDEDPTYAVVTNDDSVSYTLFADGFRIGRIGSTMTRRFSLASVSLDDGVAFSARAGRGDIFSWHPMMIDEGTYVSLRIPNRGRQ